MMATTSWVPVCNIALLNIGESVPLSAMTDDNPKAEILNSIFQSVADELQEADWFFNRKRAQLTMLYKLTVDSVPTPAAWAVDATLTGATSAVTCTVVEVLSTTEYLVTEPSDDFTDDETISDGVNTATYNTDTEKPNDFGKWDYKFQLPTDLAFIRSLCDQYHDEIQYPYEREGDYLLTNQGEAYLLYNYYKNDSGNDADVGSMPYWFRRLISAKLSYLMSQSVTANMRFRQKAEIEWDRAQLFAHEKNGEQSYMDEEQGTNDWRDAARVFIDESDLP